MWYKMLVFLIITVSLLTVLLLNLTVPIWISLFNNRETIVFQLTSYLGKTEMILDVVIVTAATIMGIIGVCWLIKQDLKQKHSLNNKSEL